MELGKEKVQINMGHFLGNCKKKCFLGECFPGTGKKMGSEMTAMMKVKIWFELLPVATG